MKVVWPSHSAYILFVKKVNPIPKRSDPATSLRKEKAMVKASMKARPLPKSTKSLLHLLPTEG